MYATHTGWYLVVVDTVCMSDLVDIRRSTYRSECKILVDTMREVRGLEFLDSFFSRNLQRSAGNWL